MSGNSQPGNTTAALWRDSLGRWVCRDAGGNEHVGVQPVRAFPLTAPDEAISVVGPAGDELLFVARLSEAPADLRDALVTALGEREFTPVIERIRAVSTFATPSTWQIDTDRGPTELVLKGEEDIRRLPGTARLLVTSAHGVVFEIRDRNALDRGSRRLLERFL